MCKCGNHTQFKGYASELQQAINPNNTIIIPQPNPAVYLTQIAILLVFTLVFIIARRMDARDVEKVSLIVVKITQFY